MKIKKGDNVTIRTGKDKGKTGNVLRVFPTVEKVLVEGVNLTQRHQKNRRMRSQGQIIEKSMPVHVSNVALSVDGKPGRVGYEIIPSEKGKRTKKERILRPGGKKI